MATGNSIAGRPVAAISLAVTLLLSACASHNSSATKHWYTPWRKAAVVAPAAVQELGVEAAEGGAVPALPQYWERNTLRVDLGTLNGSGSVRLLPNFTNGWPIRLVFSVRPGTLKQLEVTGDKRVVFNVAESAGETNTFALGSGAYSAATKSLLLHWE